MHHLFLNEHQHNQPDCYREDIGYGTDLTETAFIADEFDVADANKAETFD